MIGCYYQITHTMCRNWTKQSFWGMNGYVVALHFNYHTLHWFNCINQHTNPFASHILLHFTTVYVHVCLSLLGIPVQQANWTSFIQAISIAPLQVHYYSEVLPTQHEYCVGVSCRSAQAIESEGLAQGSYVAATLGFEPTTLWMKGNESNNVPPRPTISCGPSEQIGNFIKMR